MMMRPETRRVLPLLAIVLIFRTLSAQTAADPSFEVASIKPNQSPSAVGSQGFLPGGRFSATNFTVLGLIAVAFRADQPLPASRMIGRPQWLGVDHYDIAAKVESSATQDVKELARQMPGYLRTLLADRFKLKTHWETRQLPAYTLVLNRKDGKLGPQLRPSTIDCSKPPPDRPCGMTFGGVGIVAAVHVSIASLVGTLTSAAGRPVLDRTGLTGDFDVELQWTPEAFRLAGGREGFPPVDPNIPSIFDAVREQLGLKLESTTGPVDVLVIDHIEHPTED